MNSFLSVIKRWMTSNASTALNVPSFISKESVGSYLASVKAFEAARKKFEENDIDAAKTLIQLALKEGHGIIEESPATVSYMRNLLRFQRKIDEKASNVIKQ